MAGGRPPKFKTSEELQEKVDSYFLSLEYIDGDGLKQSRTPTIAGLAYHLGFLDRQSVYDYQEKEEFTCIIARARLYIECYWEENLDGKNANGSMFWLKNARSTWRDKHEVDHTTNGKDINETKIITKDEIMTKEELDDIGYIES